jgi:hypothetical protein
MGTWWNFQLIITASVAGIIPSQSNMKVGLARAGYTRSTVGGVVLVVRTMSAPSGGAATEILSVVIDRGRSRIAQPPRPAPDRLA